MQVHVTSEEPSFHKGLCTQVRKAEAEAEAEKAKGDAYMLARQTEALQQEKQEEAVKVQELQNTIEMLSERLVYWEGLNTEADEFSHDHLEGYAVPFHAAFMFPNRYSLVVDRFVKCEECRHVKTLTLDVGCYKLGPCVRILD